MMDISSLNISHVLKIAWKWSSWSLIWKQDGKNVSFISHIHVRFLSCVIVLLFCRCCCRSTCPPKKTWARKSSQNRDISTWSGCKNTCGYSTNKMQCSVKFAPPPTPHPSQKKTGWKKKFQSWERMYYFSNINTDEAYFRMRPQECCKQDTMHGNMKCSVERAFSKQDQAIIAAFRAVFGLVKENIPTMKYTSLLKLLYHGPFALRSAPFFGAKGPLWPHSNKF